MIGDQYGNTVDGEIRVPIKDFHNRTEWSPLGKNSWIEKTDAAEKYAMPQHLVVGLPPTFETLKTEKQWAIAHADGTVDVVRYEMETEARYELELIRTTLKMYRVPEEYWPVLMERTVETTASSWRILSE